jgi:hypothetical protein
MNNYTDKMTLSEIGENDVEMVKDAIKNANKYSFGTNKAKAQAFIKHCLDCTLKHLGFIVTLPKGKFAQKIYANNFINQMENSGVKIETRKNYTGKDYWRRGIYIYKDDVLVAFISSVFGNVREEYSKQTLKLKRKSMELFVITNAHTDNIQKVYGGGAKLEALVPPSNNAKLLH